MDDDVNPAGKPAGDGLAHMLSQSLFSKAFTRSSEVEEVYFHHIGLLRLRPC